MLAVLLTTGFCQCVVLSPTVAEEPTLRTVRVLWLSRPARFRQVCVDSMILALWISLTAVLTNESCAVLAVELFRYRFAAEETIHDVLSIQGCLVATRAGSRFATR
jgi:hypothetical protein